MMMNQSEQVSLFHSSGKLSLPITVQLIATKSFFAIILFKVEQQIFA